MRWAATGAVTASLPWFIYRVLHNSLSVVDL
jgi:hypothetical protein